MKLAALLLLLALPAFAQTTRITSGDVASSGLVGWWPMEDNGSTTPDRSGNGLTAIFSNSPPIVTGVFGSGFSAQGTNTAAHRYAVVNDNNALSFTTGSADTPFSILLWVKPSKLDDGVFTHTPLVNKRNSTSGGDEYQLLLYQGGKIAFDLFDGVSNAKALDAISSTAIPLNVWSHIAATYNAAGASGINLYVNGSSVSHTRTNIGGYARMANGPAQIVIGAAGWDRTGFSYTNTIDDARIYNRALSASEISSLYNSRKHLYGGN